MKMSTLHSKRWAMAFAALMAVIAFALAGCTQGSTSNEAPAEDGGKKLTVYTSFFAMDNLTRQVAGDKAEVTSLIPNGAEAHEWEPSPQDMAKLADGGVLVINGAGMEPWVNDVKAAAGDKLIVIEASEGVDLIKADHDHDHDHAHEGEHADGHDHDKEAHEGEKGHDHEHGEEGHHHHHGEYDPHVWLSPRATQIEVKNIAEGLAKADAKNADYYKANGEKVINELKKLDEEYAAALGDGLTTRTIVTNHEAFAYLCRDYNLQQHGVLGIGADTEPSPERMAQIVDYIKDNKVKVIFTEELVSTKVAEALAAETGAQTELMNPLESLNDEDRQAGKDYFAVMRENLKKIEAALK